MGMFNVTADRFMYDGKPLTVLSGAIHYFRVFPQCWRDRLLKLKACGLNTVETYVPWNFHEPKPGEFNFEGMADIVKFIELAGELGLFVIVRPSPYICAEWEFGGLPSWLLAEPDMKLRCFYKPFLDKVDSYYDVLIPKLVPLLCTNGGPIIAMQIENEYGSYGNDNKYLTYLKEAMVKRGVDVLLFTSDGPADHMLQGGTLPDVLKTVNFGSKPEEAFQKLREYQPDKPCMCMEYWIGWFDHWMGEHHTRPAADVADVFERMLKEGASVNFYMFHGGTNFAFYNGANFYEKYIPTITSYDYDSLLNEAGEPTDKYYAVREVISRYFTVENIALPEPVKKKSYGKVELTSCANLLEVLPDLSTPVKSVCPEPMEKLGQNYGFILYETYVSGPRKECELLIQDVHDRAQVFLNDKFFGVIDRWTPDSKLQFDIPEEGVKLGILVENMGRINYGNRLRDMKGITEGVRVNNQFLFGWTIYTLPLDNLTNIKYGDIKPSNTPAFYHGTFEADETADTFLDTKGWTKGIVWINGFNIGRYWNEGPQRTLYVPAPLLKEGKNEIVIFELHGCDKPSIQLMDEMIL